MTDKRVSWPLTLGYFVAALGVPSALAAIRWPSIQKHPLEGSLLLAGIAVLFGLAGLIHRLWVKKYSDRLIDAIGATLDVKTSTFWRSYRKRMLDHVRYVDQRGLVGYFYDPELSDVYVDVTLQPASSPDTSSSVLADLPQAGQRMKITEFLGRQQPRVLAILGSPGSGKTTLLRHTAMILCQKRRIGRGRTVPILLYLRDHVQTIVEDPDITLRALQNEAVLGRFDLTDPAGWLEQRLKAGRCVVMLDGLDEVASTQDRNVVSDWVRRQVSRYPDNDFLVTSRPLGYESAPIGGAIRVLASPFSTAQVERFVHRWYLAEERRSTGADDANVTRRAQTAADDLLTRLRANPSLHSLTVNPLLLTMIATVHRHLAALPGSRAQLYEQICQVLLWRRHEAKRLTSVLRGDQQERLVRVLGYEMMTRNARDLAGSDVTKILRPVLRGINRDLAPENVLANLASSGLLAERESGRYAFAHLTFQEYLAAAHIKDKHLERVLVKNVADPWWRETTLLYVASADASTIVRACLTDNSLIAVTLAFDCAAEASALGPDLRDELDTLLAKGLARDADPDVRTLMTGVAVTRALSEVIEIDSGALICTKQLPNRVYQLFLDDTAAAGTPRVPDIPPSGNAEPDAPARGMRAEDALAFTRWAAERTGGQLVCRLPTVAEFAEPAVAALVPKDQMCWLTDGTDRPVPSRASGAIGWEDQIPGDFEGAPMALGVFPLLTHACVAMDLLIQLDKRLPWPFRSSDVLSELRNSVRSGSSGDLKSFVSRRVPGLLEALPVLKTDGVRPHAVNYLVSVIERDLNSASEIAFPLPGSPALRADLALAAALGFGDDTPAAAPVTDWAPHPPLTPYDLKSHKYFDEKMRKACRLVLPDRIAAMLDLAGYPPSLQLPDGDPNRPRGPVLQVLAARFGVSAIPVARDTGRPEVLITATDYIVGVQSMFGGRPARLLSHFRDAMTDICRRDQPVSRQAATRARILALCVAAEPPGLDSEGLSAAVSDIVEAVTWLQLRHSGELEAPETILLAM